MRGVVFLLILWLTLSPSTGQADQTLNLRDADLSVLIELVSEVTRRNFIVDPRVQGKVSIIASEPMDSEAIYRIFLNVLELNRYTIVKGLDADRIIPIQLAKELSTDETRESTFVTRIIPIKEGNLSQIVSVIRPLLPSEAVLSAYEEGGLLILSDRENNIRRIETLIEELDQRQIDEYEIIPLERTSLETALEVVREASFKEVKVQGYAPSNAVIASGPADERARVKLLLQTLDRQPSPEVVTVIPLNYVEVFQVIELMTGLFPSSLRVTADTQTNSLLISGPSYLIEQVKSLSAQLDRRPSQVLVEGIIFEMAADRFISLGINYAGVISNIFSGGVQFSLEGQPTLTSLITSLLQTNIPQASGLLLGAADRNVAGFLSALASDASTNILSTPSLLTLDQEEAEIIVGQSVPFVTGQFTDADDNPFQAIQREDIGLNLRVTPRITADDTVFLTLEQEVSSLTVNSSAAGGEITSKREIRTHVLMQNRSLILLGGLLEDQTTETVQKVPLLGDIPLLGNLFRSRLTTEGKRILLLLLRTTIIESDQQARLTTERKYQELRGAQERESFFEGGSPSFIEFFDYQVPRLDESLMPPLPPRVRFDEG